MTSGSNTFLIDTNILVYVHDPRDHDKQGRALAVLDNLVERELAVLSVQCLSEFFSVVTRRLPEAMTADEAATQVERLIRACRVLDITPQVVQEGCRGVVQYRLSLWDSLIWAVARLNQVPFVLTEDAEDGRILESVRFLNPFSADFDMAMIGA